MPSLITITPQLLLHFQRSRGTRHVSSPQLNIQHQSWNTCEVDRHSVTDVPILKVVGDFVLPTVCSCKGDSVRGVRIGCDTDVCALDVSPASNVSLVGKSRHNEAEDRRAVAVRVAQFKTIGRNDGCGRVFAGVQLRTVSAVESTEQDKAYLP
jgi:hypothetical protein